MIARANREKSLEAVLADLADLAYFAECKAELEAIEEELPLAREALATTTEREALARQELRKVERQRKEAQAARLLAEDDQEAGALDARIAALDAPYQAAEAEARTAHSLALEAAGVVEGLETRRANLTSKAKPEAAALRAVLALLS